MQDSELAPVWGFEDFQEFLPPGGWIRDFVYYGIQCTDAPPLYHALAAATAVSAAISPWIDLVVFNKPHPLHMFTLLIGASAARKSTAIDLVNLVTSPVWAPLSQRGQRIYSYGSASPEGMLEDLSNEPNRLVLVSEWTQWHVATTGSKYWTGFSDLPNVLYDGWDLNRTLTRGRRLQIKRPRVSLLGASTPAQINASVTRHHWLAGIFARYITLHQERPPSASMVIQREEPELVERLRDRYAELVKPSSVTQAFLSGAAWSTFKDWSQNILPQLSQHVPERIAPTLGRMQEHALRLATAFEASMVYPAPVTVSHDSMLKAIQLIELGTKSLIAEFAAIPDLDQERTPLHKMRMLLRAAGPGGITRRELIRKLSLDVKQLAGVIDTLKQSGELAEQHERNAHGPATIRYSYVPDAAT
jgi:hypothetical protein